MTSEKKMKENVLLVDADALDKTICQLRAYMSRKLDRELPVADLASWIVCCAMDAGWNKPEDEKVALRVIFVRSEKKCQMQCIHPGDLTQELDGMVFADPYMGEVMLCVVTECSNHGNRPLYVQCVESLLTDKEPHELLLVADVARYGDDLLQVVKGNESHVKAMDMCLDCLSGIETMQLGFSLLHAMNVTADEVEK